MWRMIKARQTLASLLCVASFAAWAQGQPPAKPAGDPFYAEASDCTAALKARVVERQAQPRSSARDKAILSDTELGFAFIGVAYKKGLRNPEADQMLQAAEARWKALRKADQQARQQTCTTKGQQLMRDLSVLERFVVRNRAQARVDKLLDKDSAASKAP